MKKLLFSLVFIHHIFSVFAQESLEGVYTVSESGDFQTIDDAAETLNQTPFGGDVTLLIDEGTHYGNLILDSLELNGFTLSITSNGEKENTIIYPLESEDNYKTGFYFKNISGLNISDLIFRNDSIGDAPLDRLVITNSVIKIDSCDNVQINNITIESDTVDDLQLEMFVSANIAMEGVNEVEIDSCFFESAFFNLAFSDYDSSTNIKVQHSTFQYSIFDLIGRGQYGGDFEINNNQFLSERIVSSTNHIYLHGSSREYPSRTGFIGDVKITNNAFNGINSSGNTKCIYLQYFSNALIEDNDILGGYYAMFLTYGDTVLVNRNKISTTLYSGIECAANNVYHITNNTFISHNASYIIDDQVTRDELVIANNTFYRQEVPNHSTSGFLRLRDFEGDSLAIVNNLFVLSDTISRGIRLEYFDFDINSSKCLIDHNAFIKSNDQAELLSLYSFRRVTVNGESDIDSSFVTLEDWQNFQSNCDQNTMVTADHNLKYIPASSTDGESFIKTADFHLTNGTTFRKGLFYEGIGTDIDGNPRSEYAGVDLGADQYYLEHAVVAETCDEDLTLSFSHLDEVVVSYTWYFGDSTTSSEVNPTHTYSDLGQYTVSLVVCDSSGYCDSTSFVINIEDEDCKVELETPLAASLTDKVSILVYPNPTNGPIHFTSQLLSGDVGAQLINLSGELLFEGIGTLQDISVDLSEVLKLVSPGVYILKVDDEENHFTKKIIVGDNNK
ncbi:PKD domain-containing protein [Flammeovirga agarivorans]|uniref:PKD domain-containing protein n=1 Tax=Flammeovirga agarivorans TaxID=2726742 RepID=A0A7X8SKH3_9BACT|nr:PKD domain-containing protein [Flammeovirga agarivorans]NLR91901.1 PKD domain-containing protein [Flammeovirga agarivorans]